ncbi:winged helix-turn-helix transcriptional regulator [Natronorubrum halophilum]|uniref:winged helix-turn-helix transcriptional regulator n=1 Tax=Natronorubrum halophilum TaxID=1702106 RepID=UPI001EE988AD|nr:helix-turn-helix domain-containing protein [Natronorubrum halophilum]
MVEEYQYLLDDVPYIDDTPKELNETVGDLLDLMTNAHALAVFYHLFCEKRPLRFSELEGAIDVTPKVLSQRLAELTDAGLVSRRSYDEIPPRVEYEPTTKARELDPAFQFLYAWAARYGSERRTD